MKLTIALMLAWLVSQDIADRYFTDQYTLAVVYRTNTESVKQSKLLSYGPFKNLDACIELRDTMTKYSNKVAYDNEVLKEEYKKPYFLYGQMMCVNLSR